MKKLCKIMSAIAMALTLAACANKPSSVPEQPSFSSSNGTSESLSTTTSDTPNGLESSTLSSAPYVPVENSENSTDIKSESTTSSTSESRSDDTSASSESGSSTTESLPENDTETKENPDMFDFYSKFMVNLDYLFRSSYMSVYPVFSGFLGIIDMGRSSYIPS